jgi:hypothetical protein
MTWRRDCICVVFPISFQEERNCVKHKLHVKWCCYHAITMFQYCGESYLYVRHSVVIEIAACCESLTANGTFCEVQKKERTL